MLLIADKETTLTRSKPMLVDEISLLQSFDSSMDNISM